MKTAEVVVVGGGFTGLLAAASLASRGARVTVLESHLSHDPRFRGELIHPRGVRTLDLLGLKQPLFAAGGVSVQGFCVTPEAEADEAEVLLPYPASAGLGLGIEHKSMVATLRREVAARPGVTLVQGARVESLLRDGEKVIGVRCADGREVRAQLVIGADGRQSKVRRLINLEPDTQLLSYTVAVDVEGPVLPNLGYGHVFLGAPGPILAYPFGPNRVRMCIDVPLNLPRGKDAMRAALRESYAPFLPAALREGMLESLEKNPFEGCANHAIYTQDCAAPGVALLGDAGGCSHPLTATGMTSAAHDVLSLTECLSTDGLSNEALLAYQKKRYRFVRAREVFTEALYEVFRAHDAGSAMLRQGIFRYWRSSARARLKSMAILSGDESRPSIFMSEYARVVGRSTLDVFDGMLTRRALRRRARTMSALFTTSFVRLNRTVNRTLKTLVQEQRAELPALPAETARPGLSAVA